MRILLESCQLENRNYLLLKIVFIPELNIKNYHELE